MQRKDVRYCASCDLQVLVLDSFSVIICVTFTLNGQLLNESALSTAVVGGQGESLDAAAGTDTAGQHIIGVQVITTLREDSRTETGTFIRHNFNLLFTNLL